MKKIILLVLVVISGYSGFSQNKTPGKINRFTDLTVAAGSGRGTAAFSYVHNWELGKKQKWEAGFGARLTSYFGSKQEHTTAPARLARGTTVPFAVVFAPQKSENWDTLTVQRPWSNALNLSVNFGYNFTDQWSAGFNIDLVGFTLGRKTAAILTSNGITTTEPAAKPSAFNLLLTGDLDHGSLNSEFFLKYKLNSRWGIRAVYQFYFSEYKTATAKQVAPDGTLVTRFRQKGNNLGAGLAYHF